jgi:farnesol dehydrogenase
VSFARSATASDLPGEKRDGDVRDPSSVLHAVSSCDAICHLAALVAVWRRRAADFDDVNVGGLRNVLAAARKAGTPRLLYTSSFLALPAAQGGTPHGYNDYQRTKIAADRVAGEAADGGMPLVRVYPGVIYGPGPNTEGNLVGRMIADHLAGRLRGLPGAGRRWSYSWIEDVAAGHVAAMERGDIGRRYFLGGENHPQIRVFELVRDLTGRRPPRKLPASVGIAAAAFEELRAALTGRPPALTIGTVEILLRDWVLDSTQSIEELGYRITPLAEGIGRVVGEIVAGRAGTARP